ncbi:MAG: type II secretion system protein GspG [Planctomycetota bacterium]|nr:type II secretion system protein GspG [Planctomycetota bacterium]
MNRWHGHAKGLIIGLVVLVVLGVIYAIFALGRAVLTSMEQRRLRGELGLIALILNDLAARSGGEYPKELSMLLTPMVPDGPLLKEITDPWGREYLYHPPVGGQPGKVWTLGADGMPGGVGENADVDSDQAGITIPGPHTISTGPVIIIRPPSPTSEVKLPKAPARTGN